MDDVKYFIHRNSYEENPYFDYEKDVCTFPVKDIYPFIHEANDIDELRAIICKEFVINENDCLVYQLPTSDSDVDYDGDDNSESYYRDENDRREEESTLQFQEDDWD